MGKTKLVKPYSIGTWKHPHGRGEDRKNAVHGLEYLETPPRSWGRQKYNGQNKGKRGNTPTVVGKTIFGGAVLLLPWKHPHGRGEDFCG